ncbi:iron-sulfur cluster carrier protein ApbC [Parashewanella curva]|uniref:Iron-sulfur cluster carrier protein n=1 Tax=Parashewanella curva TaxID=2338552 RepID=A0A3L8Q3C9_9GAMM|nr:iron-sulfur cluster carrier protein ApbC [Parashewanella curva]
MNPPNQNSSLLLKSVKHVIAVASGKGGVGKSTTTVNLALAMARTGAKVGVLDADIYGPSIPLMLGIEDFKPDAVGEKKMTAASAHGITAQSIGFLINSEDAAIWRGPMAAGALTQLMNETAWPELDYLFVDMPPGTGDIQLTLSQKVPLTGAVIVTTPQDVALSDARKGIQMFQKVNVPILGVVENMSIHICSQCNHQEPIFGAQGGKRTAEQYQVPFLGALPLQLSIREAMDMGKPTLVSDPDSAISDLYIQIANQIVKQVAAQQQSSVSISISDDE